MQCSLPILASINPGNDLKTMLEDREAGLCSINGQDETFRMNALMLAKNLELRQRMGKNARQLLENRFSVASSAKQILVNSELASSVRSGISVDRSANILISSVGATYLDKWVNGRAQYVAPTELV